MTKEFNAMFKRALIVVAAVGLLSSSAAACDLFGSGVFIDSFGVPRQQVFFQQQPVFLQSSFVPAFAPAFVDVRAPFTRVQVGNGLSVRSGFNRIDVGGGFVPRSVSVRRGLFGQRGVDVRF